MATLLMFFILTFTKAFDSVPHNRLIVKLQGCGISGRLLAWLGNFLMGRKQKVVLSNCASEWSCVTSGVPQGSVLGPTLFNAYVCDMPFYVNSALWQFVDVVKMGYSLPGWGTSSWAGSRRLS